MEIIQLLESKILPFSEKVLEFLADGCSFPEFLTQLKQELDVLGLDIVKTVLETLDEKLRNNPARKREWTVVRKNDAKTLLTPFGQLSYKRGYYRHKISKDYRHLVDKKAGITPHSKMSLDMKAELAAACGEMSYEKATNQLSLYNPVLKVSRQTAGNCVKAFQVKSLVEPLEKRRVDRLYIEADEDHVKIDGRRAQARLIYFHEGAVGHPRRQLSKARYFTTVQKAPEDFWFEVLDDLASRYDLDSVKEFCLSGDGAPWIQKGKELFPDCVFILDKFHLAKAIMSATAHAPRLKREIYRGIRQGDKQQVMSHFAKALELAPTEPGQQRVLDTVKYIDNNWEGIQNGISHPHVGCSAEGHVSHILSARLSSRPMAWSKEGAEKMAAIRATKANGESVQDHYMAMQKQAPIIVELKTAAKKELRRLKTSFGKESHNNVPVYSGCNSLTRKALKGLNGITAV